MRMPSPARTVRASVTVCRRTGMNRTEALNTVIRCCNAIIAGDLTGSMPLESWIYEIRQSAQSQLYKRTPGTIEDWRA